MPTPKLLKHSLDMLWMMARQILTLGVAIYLFGGLVYLLLRVAVGEGFALVLLGNIFLHWAMLMSFGLMAATLFFRLRSLTVLLSPVGVAFALIYGPQILPHQQIALADSGQTLQVMAYNSAVHYTHPEDLTALVDTQSPDVLALVELSRENAAHMADVYPYSVIAGEGIGMKGLFSRYPIVSHEAFTVATDRPTITAQLDINGTLVTMFVAHPPSPDGDLSLNFYHPDVNHAPEIAALIERTDTDTPTLLMGDFNMTHHSPLYADMRLAGLHDAFHEAGRGFGGTFYLHAVPSFNGRYMWLWRDPPIARIDYIWHTSHFRAIAANSGPEMPSDHRPVSATLMLERH